MPHTSAEPPPTRSAALVPPRRCRTCASAFVTTMPQVSATPPPTRSAALVPPRRCRTCASAFVTTMPQVPLRRRRRARPHWCRRGGAGPARAPSSRRCLRCPLRRRRRARQHWCRRGGAGPARAPSSRRCLRFRYAAADALGRIGAAEAVPDLRERLRQDDDSGVRGATTGALVRLGDRAVLN